MKQMIKNLSDKASNYLDTKGLANPVEVINEEFGGETREEAKKRRAKQKPGGVLLEGAGEAPKKMRSGGTASARADGCAIKGKTRGRMI
jgi:hypothetical protein